MTLNKAFNIWFTGLPSSGKTTTGLALRDVLKQNGIKSVVLDGDVTRGGLSSDLGFSEVDRVENNRRIIYVAEIIVKSDIPVITTFISPFVDTRNYAKKIIPNFIEVFINTPVKKCIERDVKGLYKKAQNGEISNMTGLDGRYDIPNSPDIELDTVDMDIDNNISIILDYLIDKKYIK